MTIKNRERLVSVKKITQEIEGETVSTYDALYSVEDYNDKITPVEAVPAVTEMRQQMTEACEGLYRKDEKGKLIEVVPPCECEPVFTEGEPALYNKAGELVRDAIEPQPVMEEVVVKEAVEEVTDVVEFKNYHRKVFTVGVDVIPEDVLEMGDI